jgi:hypothetical protein
MAFVAAAAAQIPAPILPVNQRIVHPSIAPPPAGMTYAQINVNGTGPLFQYPDQEWNHGEGLAPYDQNDEDFGGWHNNDDGEGVELGDVHVTYPWQTWTWTVDLHPNSPAPRGLSVRSRSIRRPAASSVSRRSRTATRAGLRRPAYRSRCR